MSTHAHQRERQMRVHRPPDKRIMSTRRTPSNASRYVKRRLAAIRERGIIDGALAEASRGLAAAVAENGKLKQRIALLERRLEYYLSVSNHSFPSRGSSAR